MLRVLILLFALVASPEFAVAANAGRTDKLTIIDDNSVEEIQLSDEAKSLSGNEGREDDGGMLGHGARNVLVDRHDICRWLDNEHSESDYFVPTGLGGDWQSFVGADVNGVSAAGCCPRKDITLTSSGGVTRTFRLPIGREGAAAPLGVISVSHQFPGCETVTQEMVCVGGAWTPSGGPQSSSCAPMKTALCGPAHGRAGVTSAPTTSLCSVGAPSPVKGAGPWSWTCTGTDGAVANCSVNRVRGRVEGVCGPANGRNLKTAPATGLCVTGSPTAVTGAGPWTWTCRGFAGGLSSACRAELDNGATPVDAVCGSAHGTTRYTDNPITFADNLCSVGTPGPIILNSGGDGPWAWNCVGTDGGAYAGCFADVAYRAAFGICGTSPKLCQLGLEVVMATDAFGATVWQCGAHEQARFKGVIHTIVPTLCRR